MYYVSSFTGVEINYSVYNWLGTFVGLGEKKWWSFTMLRFCLVWSRSFGGKFYSSNIKYVSKKRILTNYRHSLNCVKSYVVWFLGKHLIEVKGDIFWTLSCHEMFKLWKPTSRGWKLTSRGWKLVGWTNPSEKYANVKMGEAEPQFSGCK